MHTTSQPVPASSTDRAGDVRPAVLVVGPGPDSAGGIWAAMATLLRSSLAGRYRFTLVPTHRDGSYAAKFLRALRGFGRIASILLRHPPRLVWIHTASEASFRRKAIVALMAQVRGVPYVLHVHGGSFHRWYAGVSAPERALVRHVLRRARTVIALTPEWERRLNAIAPCRTVAIMNPVTVPALPDPPLTTPGRVVCIGRLGDLKGSRVLVRAIATLRDRGVAAHAHLAGDGEHDLVAAEIATLGVEDRVTLHTWLTPAEVGALLDSAAVFALPSRDEGLPVALLEAMAHSLPVVVTPVGGIPDLVRVPDHGAFVQPDDPAGLADALQRLLTAPEDARTAGAAGRRTVEERCAVPVVVAQLERALDDALGRTDGAR